VTTKTEDSAGRRAWSVFLAAHALLIEKIEARLAAAGLPPLTWYDALWALERAPEHRLRFHELAQKMVLSRSNITRLTDRLEFAGLVARERSSQDRRGAYGVLTRAGAQMRQKMWPVYRAAIDELFAAHLSSDEAGRLEATLTALLHSAQER
jgi:DNA-binding MarR family transcriptional regulator